MKKPRLGSAVIILKDGKILLGRRNKQNANGLWVIPGGGVEFGETLMDAAMREAREETGLEIEIEKLVCHKEIIAVDADYHSVIFFYLARPVAGRLTPGGDLSDVKFFTIDEIKNLEKVQSVELVLKEAGFWK